MKEKIESYELKVKSAIITMKNNMKNYISDIFEINGESLYLIKIKISLMKYGKNLKIFY